MATNNWFEVLDPTVEAIPAQAVIAPRPETLNDTVLGLLANGKPNSDELLKQVHEILADRYEFRDVVSRNKGDSSRPCSTDIIEELVKACDVVITASGD